MPDQPPPLAPRRSRPGGVEPEPFPSVIRSINPHLHGRAASGNDGARP